MGTALTGLPRLIADSEEFPAFPTLAMNRRVVAADVTWRKLSVATKPPRFLGGYDVHGPNTRKN